MEFGKFVAAGVAAVSVMAAGAAAQASTWIGSGTNEGNPVSAKAEITFASGLLTVDLTNTSTNMIASNQAISGIFITFDNAATSGSSFTQSGALVNLDGSANTKTSVAGSPNHWGGSVLGTGVVRLWTLTGGQPKNLISQNTANFANLNNGVGNFNPYIDGVGHFTYQVVGAVGQVKAVSFLYGTDAGNPLISSTCTEGCGGGNAVPEPGAWALMILGFGASGAMLRRRRAIAA